MWLDGERDSVEAEAASILVGELACRALAWLVSQQKKER